MDLLELIYKNGKRKNILVEDVEFLNDYCTICYRNNYQDSFSLRHGAFTDLKEVRYKKYIK